MWAGQPDPAETRKGLRQDSDQEGQNLRRLFEELERVFPNRQTFSARDVHGIAEQGGPLADMLFQLSTPVAAGGLPSTRSLGRWLQRHRDQVRGGVQLRTKCVSRLGNQYYIERLEPEEA